MISRRKSHTQYICRNFRSRTPNSLCLLHFQGISKTTFGELLFCLYFIVFYLTWNKKCIFSYFLHIYKRLVLYCFSIWEIQLKDLLILILSLFWSAALLTGYDCSSISHFTPHYGLLTGREDGSPVVVFFKTFSHPLSKYSYSLP